MCPQKMFCRNCHRCGEKPVVQCYEYVHFSILKQNTICFQTLGLTMGCLPCQSFSLLHMCARMWGISACIYGGQRAISSICLVFYLVLTQGLWLFPVCLTRLAGRQADREFPCLCLHAGTETAHLALGGSRSSHTCIKCFTHWALCPAQTQVLTMIRSLSIWTHPMGS